MFERAYRKFRANMEELVEWYYFLRWHLLCLMVNLTLPLWIIPYAIWRKIRRKNK